MNILKSSSFSKKVQSMLNVYGNEQIKRIKIGRVPLSSTTMFLLNIVSLGDLNQKMKTTSYDKLFHLFLYIETDTKSFILEKNEVICLSNKKIPAKSEIIDVSYQGNLTLNILLSKTQELMKQDFYLYSGRDNNCQFFIMNILKANHLLNIQYQTFILQNTQQLFDSNPNFRKIVNTITDTSGVVNKISEIPSMRGSINNILEQQMQSYNIENELKKPHSNPFFSQYRV